MATKTKKQLTKLTLPSLGKGMPGLTKAWGISLAEAAAVCLEDRQHQAGVQLTLLGLQVANFSLQWATVDEQQKRCYHDPKRATELGACCIAIHIVKEVTGKVVVDQSVQGPGFDYWIADPDYDDNDLPFSKAQSRLEVSGILNGSKSEIEARVNLKLRQITPSDAWGPGYVAVIEFGNPEARLVEKLVVK